MERRQTWLQYLLHLGVSIKGRMKSMVVEKRSKYMLKLGEMVLESRACLQRIAEVHGGNSDSWRCFIDRHSDIVDAFTGNLSTAIASSIQLTFISILDMHRNGLLALS